VAGHPFDLPQSERLKRYRQLATEAEIFAATITCRVLPSHSVTAAELRNDYLTIAGRYRELAEQLEKIHARPRLSEFASATRGETPVPNPQMPKHQIVPVAPDLQALKERAEIAEVRAREAEAILRRLEAERKIREFQAIR
jgi:hypothetical protein